MSEYRTLNIRCSTTGMRTATFHGREHTIIPVVALVEGVIQAGNSDAPELALASQFSRFPDGWNGEPVVLNHPQDETTGFMVSANTPEILEKYQIGTIFGTHVDGKKLRMNAYIDNDRVAQVGEKAQELMRNLEESGVIEISVGCYLDAVHSEGMYNGQRYARVWQNIVPDHLAFLEKGVKGACSNEAGCGAGISRAAMHVVTKEGFTLEGEPMANKAEQRSLRERLVGMFTTLMNPPDGKELTEAEIREILELKAEEPVAAVVPPVAAHECGCGGKVSAEGAEGGIKVHKNAERITALIANPKTQWAEIDREYLQTQTDERLAALEAAVKPEPEVKPEPVVAAAAKVEPKVEDLPAAWQAAIRAAAEQEAATRTGLVDKLVAAQKGLSKADLDAMPFDLLQKVGQAVLKNSGAQPVDYSAAAGYVRANSADDEEFADDAPDLGAAIRTARGIQ